LQKTRLTAGEYAAADLEFHHALAVGSGNLLFTMLSRSLNDVMTEVRLWAFKHDGIAAAERAVMYHTRILDKVRAKDVEGAAQAMREHLADAQSTLQRVVQDGTFLRD